MHCIHGPQKKISSVLNIWSLPCHHISLPQSFQASKLGKLCIWAHHRISWEGFTHFPAAGIKQLSWEGIEPTREVTKSSICIRFIHTEATMSQREQRKLLFLSSRSKRNWMQARNIKHFANWRFGNYLSNCRAISKEISSGRPPILTIPKSTISLVRFSRKDRNERGTNREAENRYRVVFLTGPP